MSAHRLRRALPSEDAGAARRARLECARLYLVCTSTGERDLAELLRAAVAGGVDIVQLRDKHLPDEQLLAAAQRARALCEELGALLIINDRPLLAREVRADGLHVGQDDMPVAQARELLGPHVLIGLSTHTPEQIDAEAATSADYIGVGPVHETPTKPGRAAVGLELVRYAAAHARRPFFAIGGLHVGNLGAVIDAGATRVCVLRAISAAADPERAARRLRTVLDGASGSAA